MRAVPALLALAGCLSIPAAGAQADANADPAPARLIAEIGARAEAMDNLEQLCDGIGARMTGSPQLRAAQSWAMGKLASYGAVNVHEEAYDMGRPWRRGVAQARLLNANGQAIDIVQQGWSEGTAGPVQGDVALLDVKTLDQLALAAPGLRGKIVLVVSGPKPDPVQQQHLAQFKAEVKRIIQAAQFGAVLLVSNKDSGIHDMWGGTSARFTARVGIIKKEGASLLRRLLARGLTPRLEIKLGGGFGKAPVQAYNVVADFPGSDLAGETVILGAHQDSWDLGPGATDNGAGVVMALEVARALHASGVKPRRTLRIVLFSGEEQGLLGSRAYVQRHRAELAQIQAVLVQDGGGGPIIGFPDMRVPAWKQALIDALAPAQVLGGVEVPGGMQGDSDQDSFFEQGIPAFAPDQDPLDYRSHTQHSELDTVDHVSKANLVLNAQTTAVLAWGLLNGPRLPHRAATVDQDPPR